MLNSGFSNTGNSTEGYMVSNENLLYRHKFKKKGRTFSVTGAMQYNDSRAKGTQNAINNFFSNGSISLRDTLEKTALNSITQSYSVKANYTEPLSKRSLIEFRGFYNINRGDLDRKTFDYNKTSGKYDKINTGLSNAFENMYSYTGVGMSIRTQQKKYGYSAGANLQYAKLNSHLKDVSSA